MSSLFQEWAVADRNNVYSHEKRHCFIKEHLKVSIIQREATSLHHIWQIGIKPNIALIICSIVYEMNIRVPVFVILVESRILAVFLMRYPANNTKRPFSFSAILNKR